MREIEIYHDAAGYHAVVVKAGKVVGWSFNHPTREAAEKAVS